MELKLTFDDYEGSVTIRVANNIERLKTLDALGFDVGELEKGKAEDKFKSFGSIIKLMERSKPHYKKVDLKKDGKVYKSYNDLNDDPECQAIMMECATKALLSVGDNEKKSKS